MISNEDFNKVATIVDKVVDNSEEVDGYSGFRGFKVYQNNSYSLGILNSSKVEFDILIEKWKSNIDTHRRGIRLDKVTQLIESRIQDLKNQGYWMFSSKIGVTVFSILNNFLYELKSVQLEINLLNSSKSFKKCRCRERYKLSLLPDINFLNRIGTSFDGYHDGVLYRCFECETTYIHESAGDDAGSRVWKIWNSFESPIESRD